MGEVFKLTDLEKDFLSITIDCNMKISNKFWEGLDWSLIPILGFLSIFFVTGVLEDYVSETANVTNEEVAIQEQPTITLAFGKPGGTLKRFNKDDFDIYYYLGENGNFTVVQLKEGDNELGDEIIHLRRMRRVYSIAVKTGPNYEHKPKQRRFIKVMFRGNIDPNRLLYWSLNVYVTSEANSYGVENNAFFDGKPFITKMKLKALLVSTQTNQQTKQQTAVVQMKEQTYGRIFIKPKMLKLLKQKSGCRDKSFYEEFQYEFVDLVEKACNNYCIPTHFPNNPIRRCEPYSEEDDCAYRLFHQVLWKSKYRDSAPCTKIEYEGTSQGQYPLEDIRKQVSTYISLWI